MDLTQVVDNEELGKAAYAEIEAEKEGDKPGEPEATPAKDAKKKPEPDASDDEPAEGGEKDGEPAEGKDKADDKPADKADDDKSGEDEPAPEEGDHLAVDKKITEYAEKHKMTYAEAKEDIEKTGEILKQYKNDPAEMARAMRNKDREYHKLKADQEKAAAKKEPLFRRMSDEQFIGWAKAEVAKKPEFVEKFREKFPARSESMSDEAIIEEIVDRELTVYHEKATEKENEIKSAASKRRDDLVVAIPEADRRFIPEVKALLQNISDADLLNSDDIVKDALLMAKGKTYDSDIKAAEERGFKRAKEGAQIVGVKPSASGSAPVKGKTSVTLNAKQKERAEQMFGNMAGVDGPEDCYKAYREAFEDELKKDPKFV
jgi:hypothetical protein